VPHRYSQAVLDLGERPRADTVTLDIDTGKRPTYFERVTVEASDDRATWRIVRSDAIVYRVADDRGRGSQTITFPESESRWLRLRIADPQEPFPITGARVDDTHSAQAPALAPLALTATSSEDVEQHEQIWTFDGNGVSLRPSAVTFADGSTTFARHAVVESSDDGTTWSQAGEGEISRFAKGGAQTSFAFTESSAPHWRVVVENGNDAPVPGLRPSLLARPHDVVFQAAPQRRYRLLSGNDAVGPPTYDLGARLAHSAWRAEPASTVATNQNAAAAETPDTQRSPGMLTAVLLVVAVALGALALFTVRGAKRA
jgi:hypothetical protein